MTNTDIPEATEPVVRLLADHTMTKHLGNWTTARRFQVRARRGAVVLDLRSSRIAAGPIELDLDIDHGLVKLLLPSDAAVDQWDLHWTGSGKVKDGERSLAGDGGRVFRITGRVSTGEVRVHRGGMAIVSAMFSRAYLKDLKRAYREGGQPTVDDPTRVA